MELRVARVISASLVAGSDKLLQLTLDLGSEMRQVFSGIRSSYAPEQLVGRLVIVVANLEPRKMRFGVSAGMVLCASGDGDGGLPAQRRQRRATRHESQLDRSLARAPTVTRQYRIST